MRRLTPFPDGSDHALFPFVPCRPPQGSMRGPEATPLTSHASTFWLSPSADSQTRYSLCSRPLRAYSHLENRESRNSLEVSQSCGLKNDLLCSRPLRAQQPLVQQTSSGPAVTWRTLNELLRQSPLCQVGCATFPEDFTRPVSLGDTGQCYWTSRRLHSSRHTGRASTSGHRTNSQKPLLLRTTGCCVSFPPLCSGIWRE